MAKRNQRNNSANMPIEYEDVLSMVNDGFGEENFSLGDFSGVIGHIIEASNVQIKVAAELTNVILQNDSSNKKSEREILDIYKNAARTVSESYPMKTLLTQTEGI